MPTFMFPAISVSFVPRLRDESVTLL